MVIQGSRPGDRRVRVGRGRPDGWQLKPVPPRRQQPRPAVLLITAFTVLIAIGTGLLMLPIATHGGIWTPPLDALFTATSAVCVTGLVVVDTARHWSGFGQLVILMLVQAGGFGIMAGSTLLLLIVTRRAIGLRDRIVVKETTGELQLGGVLSVVRRVALFTLVAEGIGAVLLALVFLVDGAAGDLVAGVWWGLFYAISAFNNAGFDLTGGFQSLAPFTGNWAVLVPMGLLIVLGGVGWAVVADATLRRRWWRLGLESKIVLLTTISIILVGTVAIAALEWDDHATLGAMAPLERPFAALFESVSLRTAGFSTMPTGAFAQSTLLVLVAMMFIGGASGSTAGGIKVNTFSVLLVAIISTARGHASPSAFGRRLGAQLVYRALSVALLGVACLFLTTLLLSLVSGAGLLALVFEAVSALGTVGSSTGITPSLDTAGRIIVIGAMFVGRLGPLTLVLALAARSRPDRFRPALETMRIG
jgi:trk system potassium uptake protein TrkH